MGPTTLTTWDATANSNAGAYAGPTSAGAAIAIEDGDIKINGVSIGAIAAASNETERGGQVAAAVNRIADQTGVTATFDTATGAVQLEAKDGRNIELVSDGATTKMTADITGMAIEDQTALGTAEV